MSIHILGICGTFMGSIARLAKQMGYDVSGSDADAYPPMSTQLEQAGIPLSTGYTLEPLQAPGIKQVIVGNVMRRGSPVVEYLLNQRLPILSGARWVAENILKDKHVLAVAGTHGKTSTASMLAWLLSSAGLSPGFLIGGVPKNFGVSAKLGDGSYFVIEADEYDTAFFDKRSKFMHYWPTTLVINNLEFDHADIFADLSAIQTQFHHLVRTVPGRGLIIYPTGTNTIEDVLAQGCWSPLALTQVVTSPDKINQAWAASDISKGGSRFTVWHHKKPVGEVSWSQIGLHQVSNALSALAAAHHVGVQPEEGIAALNQFAGVARRLDVCGKIGSITVYDDFAHHPTAIHSVLKSVRANVSAGSRVVVAIEFGSYTMRTGYHAISVLAQSLSEADLIYCLKPPAEHWNAHLLFDELDEKIRFFDDVTSLMKSLVVLSQPGDHIIIMSNSHFGGIQKKIVAELKKREQYETS